MRHADHAGKTAAQRRSEAAIKAAATRAANKLKRQAAGLVEVAPGLEKFSPEAAARAEAFVRHSDFARSEYPYASRTAVGRRMLGATAMRAHKAALFEPTFKFPLLRSYLLFRAGLDARGRKIVTAG